GACRGNPGPGAWGSLILSQKNEVLYEGSGVELGTTNNRMELMGAIDCLRNLKDDTNKKIAVISDSKYVVDGITTWVAGWKKRGWKKADKKTPENLDLWQDLDSLAETFQNLKFQWVKGHSGYPQNEYVDELANHALDDAGF
ncbi:MAG: ribonuclease HI, partial [Halobacteriovoraceae bacterium]|nr:ribonuclease HI [Halobacteriovoraceae bacterium]